MALTSPGFSIDDPAYFDRLAEVEEAHWWSFGIWGLSARWLTRAIRGRRDLRALDIGCGAGLTLARLAQLPGIAAVVGLDPSPEALSHSARRHGHPLVRGTALALPFPDGSFDVVTSFDVFQHLPEGSDRDAASELRRVLRPGGIALVRANGRGISPPSHVGGPLYRLGDLVRVVSGSGLRLRRATYANCLPALAQELRGRFRPGSIGGGHPAGGGLRIRLPDPRINRLMGAVASAESILAGSLGIPLPFGHSTLVMAEK